MLKKIFASRKNPYVPGLDKPETLEINLSGSTFRIQLPPNSVADLPAQLKGYNIDIYNRKHYADLSHLEDYQNSRLPYMGLLKRAIALYGRPWQSSYLGSIFINALVCRVDSLPERMSCLRPNHFEQVVDRDLYFSVGPACVRYSKMIAPINWQIIKPLRGEEWIYCEAVKDFSETDISPDSFERANYEAFLYASLDDQYYLRLNFDVHGYDPESQSRAANTRVLDSIIHSCELVLSHSHNEKKLQTNLGQESVYSEKRSPEKWIHHKWRNGDYRKNEPETVIVESGTPAPTFQFEIL